MGSLLSDKPISTRLQVEHLPMFPKGFPSAEDKTQPESKTNPRSMEDEVILNFFPKTPLGPTAHNSP